MGTNPATVAVPKEDILGENRWRSMHQRFVTEAHEKEPEVIFLGDSLFALLGVTKIWDDKFVPLHCLNFGINGDETQHLLWRIENGELDNVSPKVLVLQIGTNNCVNCVDRQTPEQVYEGIQRVVTACRAKQPLAHIMVMTIPPRGQSHNPVREKVAALNHMIVSQLLTDMGNTKLQVLQLDPGLFLNPNDNTISHLDMFDYLHFTTAGYLKFCKPILEELESLLISVDEVEVK